MNLGGAEYEAVVFDLGGTLVHYCSRSEFPYILRQAVKMTAAYLAQRGMANVVPDLWERVASEDYEADDYRVRPLEGRLQTIFGIPEGVAEDEMQSICSCFMKPILARGMVHADVVPALTALRESGRRLAILSNTPWGSPSGIWRRELRRIGLADLVDEMVFCRDAGWRKPAAAAFRRVQDELGCAAEDMLFVGDHPHWDYEGARGVGVECVLIDRSRARRDLPGRAIHSLSRLAEH